MKCVKHSTQVGDTISFPGPVLFRGLWEETSWGMTNKLLSTKTKGAFPLGDLDQDQ